MKSEFFSSPKTFFNAKYVNTIDITEHKLAKGIVIKDTCELIIVNNDTTEATTVGIFAIVTADITVVNGFLFFLFNANDINTITKTESNGVIVATPIDHIFSNILYGLQYQPIAKHLDKNFAATHITKTIIAYFKYFPFVSSATSLIFLMDF